MHESDRDNQRWRATLTRAWGLYRVTCFRIAFGFLRNAADAEEICQMAFTKAWEHRGKIREDEAMLRAWLCTVVMNDCRLVLRRRKTEKKVLSAESQTRAYEACGAAGAVELNEAIASAMSKLPERQRLVVSAKYFGGLSGKQISALLGISVPEVSHELHRAFAVLRPLVAEWSSA